jgi:hypothetical protein
LQQEAITAVVEACASGQGRPGWAVPGKGVGAHFTAGAKIKTCGTTGRGIAPATDAARRIGVALLAAVCIIAEAVAETETRIADRLPNTPLQIPRLESWRQIMLSRLS